MSCLSTGKYHKLENEEFEYIRDVLVKTNIEPKCDHLLDDEFLDQSVCIRVGYLLKNHIEANKIFEMNTGKKRIPVIVDDVNNKPNGCNALSMTSLVLLSKTASFLLERKRGVKINQVE